MAQLDHFDAKECEALFKTGTVQAINATSLDVQIGGDLYQNLPVHYHCVDAWKNESHPHSIGTMLRAFLVSSEVLVLFEDEEPVYVVGFKDHPRGCSYIIALHKLGDWWYWVIIDEQGYHADPGVSTPTEPLVVVKWDACEESQEKEYFRETNPFFSVSSPQEADDDCGLINMTGCCGSFGSPQQGPWEVQEHFCPCGGYAYDSENDEKCRTDCNCGSHTEYRYWTGRRSMECKNEKTADCQAGYSWDADITTGKEEKFVRNAWNSYSGGRDYVEIDVLDSVAGSYMSYHICNEEEPYLDYQECKDSPCYCTSWNGEECRWTIEWALQVACCVREIHIGGSGEIYSSGGGNWTNQFDSGSKLTSFDGSYSQHSGGVISVTETKRWIGETCGGCHWCDEAIEYQCTYNRQACIYSEISYGVDGSVSTYKNGDHFAVMLTKLILSSEGEQKTNTGSCPFGDSTETQISATTQVVLRIVEGATETDYVLAQDDYSDSSGSLLCSRQDLGVKPDCSANDRLPASFAVRGFHWYEKATGVVLFVAFVFRSQFKAYFFEKTNGSWQQTELTTFETFVSANSLDTYTQFVN